jgi:hypothetical protein
VVIHAASTFDRKSAESAAGWAKPITIRAGFAGDGAGFVMQRKKPSRLPIFRGAMPQPQMSVGDPIALAAQMAQTKV